MRSAAVRHEQFIARVGPPGSLDDEPQNSIRGFDGLGSCKNSGQAASCDQNALVASADEFSLHKASAKAKRWGLLNLAINDVMKTGGTYRTSPHCVPLSFVTGRAGRSLVSRLSMILVVIETSLDQLVSSQAMSEADHERRPGQPGYKRRQHAHG